MLYHFETIAPVLKDLESARNFLGEAMEPYQCMDFDNARKSILPAIEGFQRCLTRMKAQPDINRPYVSPLCPVMEIILDNVHTIRGIAEEEEDGDDDGMEALVTTYELAAGTDKAIRNASAENYVRNLTTITPRIYTAIAKISIAEGDLRDGEIFPTPQNTWLCNHIGFVGEHNYDLLSNSFLSNEIAVNGEGESVVAVLSDGVASLGNLVEVLQSGEINMSREAINKSMVSLLDALDAQSAALKSCFEGDGGWDVPVNGILPAKYYRIDAETKKLGIPM